MIYGTTGKLGNPNFSSGASMPRCSARSGLEDVDERVQPRGGVVERGAVDGEEPDLHARRALEVELGALVVRRRRPRGARVGDVDGDRGPTEVVDAACKELNISTEVVSLVERAHRAHDQLYGAPTARNSLTCTARRRPVTP